jgi:hypothetical protein
MLSLCLINLALCYEDVWGSGGIAPTIHCQTRDGVDWSYSHPGRFTPGERSPGTHCIGGWVGPTAGLDAVENRKTLPLPGINPGRQPVAISTNEHKNQLVSDYASSNTTIL